VETVRIPTVPEPDSVPVTCSPLSDHSTSPKAENSKNMAMTAEGDKKGGGRKFTKSSKGVVVNAVNKAARSRNVARTRRAKDCPKPKKNDEDKKASEGTGMFVGMAHHVSKSDGKDLADDMYLLDSGANVHVTDDSTVSEETKKAWMYICLCVASLLEKEASKQEGSNDGKDNVML